MIVQKSLMKVEKVFGGSNATPGGRDTGRVNPSLAFSFIPASPKHMTYDKSSK
jgi:hypothetical protein